MNKLAKIILDPNEGCENETDEVQGEIIGGEKRKRDADDQQNEMVDYSEMYLHNHPQRQTHQPHLLPYTEYSHHVPNFLGGSLPRRDAGDIDNYAATMLTLFKPWRSGIDLKPETQMWTEVFQSFIFSDRYLHLMDNFNLRYECSDARDDFVAQRKLIEKNEERSSTHATLTMKNSTT